MWGDIALLVIIAVVLAVPIRVYHYHDWQPDNTDEAIAHLIKFVDFLHGLLPFLLGLRLGPGKRGQLRQLLIGWLVRSPLLRPFASQRGATPPLPLPLPLPCSPTEAQAQCEPPKQGGFQY